MRRIVFLFLPLCSLFFACEKQDEPVDISPVPVFTVEGTLNGMPITMAAGEQGMYMYTFSREELDGTFAFGGRIAKENCENDCGPALEIFLLDTIPFITQHGEIRIWNSPGEYLFHGSVLDDTIKCEMGITNQSYSAHGGLQESWQFNDGCIVEGKLNENYQYFPSVGPVKITLRMRDTAGNEASVKKTLDYYQEHDTGLHLKANICSPGKAAITVENPYSISDLEYKWSNNQNGDSICVDLDFLNTTYAVTVSEGTINETVLSCTVKKNGSSLSYLQADYRFDLHGQQFSSTDAWPRVVIRYRDANGIWFDSRNIHQNDYCNYFSLSNIKPYHTNYQGLKTKKADAYFSASLRDNSQQLINLEHFKVTFGFGSKE